MRNVDLRSDTLTKPTAGMRATMLDAAVGDDVFGEDPTINALQERVAALAGMEAALFVTSGTQGNQVCLNAHTSPGQEAILDINSHIFNYESGSPAMLAGVQLHPLHGQHGVITVEQISAVIRPDDDHYPQTGIICLENTHNRAGGTIYPLSEIERISAFAKSRQLPLHLDGARLWNAVVASGISLKQYCQYFDSVSLCFSKGMGAPVGSVIAGTAAFIRRAHFFRKAYGGGIRQGGILAAACLHALDNHLTLLEADHDRARHFGSAIAELPGITLDLSTVQTNIVIFEIDQTRVTVNDLITKLAENNIHMFGFGGSRVRAVTHLGVDDDDIAYTISVFQKIFK